MSFESSSGDSGVNGSSHDGAVEGPSGVWVVKGYSDDWVVQRPPDGCVVGDGAIPHARGLRRKEESAREISVVELFTSSTHLQER